MAAVAIASFLGSLCKDASIQQRNFKAYFTIRGLIQSKFHFSSKRAHDRDP